MAGNTVKDMTTNFGKLDKFEGHDFRRWQKKMLDSSPNKSCRGDVLTTVDGAELGLLVAMRYLIVVIVIMRLRMTSMLIKRRQTIPRHEVQQVSRESITQGVQAQRFDKLEKKDAVKRSPNEDITKEPTK
ncbi:hypothetical protein Tco_0583727 [Tanacetum coccineum]